MKAFIYTKDVAAMLGIDRRTVMSYVRRGLLNCTEGEVKGRGKAILFSRDEVERLKSSLGDIPDLEEKVRALRKEYDDEARAIEKDIDDLQRGARSYKRMFAKKSIFLELCASAIESIGSLGMEPFTKREVAILRLLMSGEPIPEVAKRFDLTGERVRQVANRAMRLLVKRVPDRVADEMEQMQKKISDLEATVEQLNKDNDKLRTIAKKKGAMDVVDGTVYSRPIRDLFLCVRADNCLRVMGVETIGELCSLKPKELLGWRNFGHQSLLDVTNKLASMGLALGTMPHVDNLSYLYRD